MDRQRERGTEREWGKTYEGGGIKKWSDCLDVCRKRKGEGGEVEWKEEGGKTLIFYLDELRW